MRQVDLAKSVGINPASLSRLECGQFTPRPELLQKICKVLNASPEDFEREPEADPNPPVRLDVREADVLRDWRRLPRHLRDYLTHLETLGKAAKTVNNKRASISRFCQWLKKDKGAIDRNPVTDTDAAKVIRSEIHFLTRPQMDAVLELAPAAGVGNEVAFAFYAALRLSELRRLQWSDIRTTAAGRVIVLPNPTDRRTKTRTVQSVPVNANLAAVIDGMTRGKPGEHVFDPRYKRAWCNLLDPIKADVPELIGWHDFRRTAGSLLVQAGVELYLVSKFLRHSTVTTTEKHYAHLRPDVHRREAIDLL